MSYPFFTIIIATYNASATLPRLLDSLAGQSFRDFELVIQDGGSRDDTVAAAESYRDRLPALALASEPDSGIYDAWNKALARARGEWVLFLGADDTLSSESTLACAKEVLDTCSVGVLFACGRLDRVTTKGALLQTLTPQIEEASKLLREGIMPVGHPALFHRKQLFAENRFDTGFRIAADYDFLCRTFTDPAQAVDLGLTVTRMGRGGISDNPASILRLRWECAVISSRYFSGSWTFSCCLGLLKGCILWIACFLLGKRAPAVLDAGRRLRGLPPSWEGF